MSCYHPIPAFKTPTGVVFSEKARHDILGSIELPCGMCIGCRMRKAEDWTIRCMHEASLHKRNCFITLTYARDKCPPYGTLEHKDFQDFMKRMRKTHNVRFYMCGEYGPQTRRPHYHANLFGVDFREDWKPIGKSSAGHLFYESPTLTKLWGHGKVTVQPLTKETAGYTARYIMKKQLGESAKTAYQHITEDGEIIELKPEYAAMSLKPGIGARWFDKYKEDIYRHDVAILEGRRTRPPKYYDKLLKRTDDTTRPDDIEYARQQKALKGAADNTTERRLVREAVHNAKVKTLARKDIP